MAVQALLWLAIACGAAEPGVVEVDGALDEWRDAPRSQPFAGLSVRCWFDEQRFQLMIDGLRDGGAATVVAGRLRVPVKLGKGGPQPAPRGVELATTRRSQGWAFEVAVPRDAVRASGKLWLQSGKVMIDLTPETGAAAEAEKALREHLGLGGRAPDYDRRVELGFAPGPERLLRFGKVVAVLAEEYSFFELPLGRPADLKEFGAVDLEGGGQASVVARWVERGGGGERDLLGVFKVAGSGWKPVFAAEIGKRVGGGALDTRVSWVPRGRGRDLVLEALPARGLGAATYREAPASDALPILLPWGERKKARIRFANDQYQELE